MMIYMKFIRNVSRLFFFFFFVLEMVLMMLIAGRLGWTRHVCQYFEKTRDSKTRRAEVTRLLWSNLARTHLWSITGKSIVCPSFQEFQVLKHIKYGNIASNINLKIVKIMKVVNLLNNSMDSTKFHSLIPIVGIMAWHTVLRTKIYRIDILMFIIPSLGL